MSPLITRFIFRRYTPVVVRRILLAAAAIASVAGVGYALLPSTLPYEPPITIAVAAVVVAALLSETMVVTLNLRASSQVAVTFVEGVMVLSVLYVAPRSAVVAIVAGRMLGMLVRREDALRFLFNSSVGFLEVVVIATGAQVVLRGEPPFGDGSYQWAFLLVVVVLSSMCTSAAAHYAIRTATGKGLEPRSVVAGTVTALANGGLGVAGALLIWADTSSRALVGAILVGSFVIHAHYQRLQQSNYDLRALQSVIISDDADRTLGGIANRTIAAAFKVLRPDLVAVYLPRNAELDEPVVVHGTKESAESEPIVERVEDDAIEAVLAGEHPRMDPAWWRRHDLVAVPLTIRSADGDLTGAVVMAGVEARSRLHRDEKAMVHALVRTMEEAVDRTNLLLQLQQRADEARQQARTDQTTGALSGLGYVEQLDRLLGQGQELAVIAVKITTYEDVRTSLGAERAEEMMEALAKRLRTLPGVGEARLARTASSEFRSIVNVADETDLATVIDQHVTRLADPWVDKQSVTLPVVARVGFAASVREDTATEIERRATVALATAVRSHTAAQQYEADDDPAGGKGLEIAGRLRDAIENEQIDIFYQPQVDLRSGAVVGAEALIRWQDPFIGTVHPEQIVAAAERTGDIHILTRSVIDRAVAQIASWHDDGLDVSVSVNISALNILDISLPKYVQGALDKNKVLPGRLTLELTESAVLTESARSLEVLNAIRADGVGLAIDDFGTGYSSLVNIRKLPVTEVKIDKEFVMKQDAADRAFVRGIVRLGSDLGLTVVAEGVESLDVQQYLTTIGCAVGQGYLWSRPLDAQAFRRWAATHGTVRAVPGRMLLAEDPI